MTTTPLGGILMGDRCLAALKALGGKATTGKVRAQAQADWGRPLTDAQVAVTLARLSREHSPRVTKHPAPGGGWVWRAAGMPAAGLPEAGAAQAGAGPCLADG